MQSSASARVDGPCERESHDVGTNTTCASPPTLPFCHTADVHDFVCTNVNLFCVFPQVAKDVINLLFANGVFLPSMMQTLFLFLDTSLFLLFLLMFKPGAR